ncbi:MAG TPA: sodium:alanine symporter family protein [Bacteriovoracaceae bacterium]|nr:sodium:alanine symporter family protein [Bacteriovoracaceae bacterium]
MEQWTADLANLIWGLPLVILLVASGIFFTIYFGFPQIRFFKYAVEIVVGKHDRPEDKGEISHFQALCAALSATVGLGNIAGVAVAITLGGPGAVLWLWLAGFIGMCTKFTEVTLSLLYRQVNPDGTVNGGPMFVIKNGLSKHFMPLAWMYAIFTILSSMGAGNMFQANQMASVVFATTGIPAWASGLVFCLMAALILIGGIKRIGKVTGKLVPFMVMIYFLGAISVVIHHYDQIPYAFNLIFEGAFKGTAAIGAFSGVAVKEVIILGIKRASFSNEAGMGSSAMAHSAAKSTPIEEGIVALLEPFIDTIVVCTITALSIILTDSWQLSGIEGSDMTAHAFQSVLGPWGRYIVTLTVTLFAFSTMISWSYYGEQGVTFIFGKKFIPVYRVIFIAMIYVGAITKLNIVLNLSDAFYGMLAFPNIIACYFLLPKVKEALRNFKA